MIKQLLHSDRGITLTELLVAMVVAALITGGVLTWTSAVTRADQRSKDTLEIIDQLRWAKTRLVAELRFAEDVFPPGSGDDEISMYVESNGTDGMQAGVGELVTYEILGSGILQRTSDDPAEDPINFAEHVLPASSSMVMVGGDTVEIEFVVDTDLTDEVNQRMIKTSVKVRNKA